jgi:hypothetical protein
MQTRVQYVAQPIAEGHGCYGAQAGTEFAITEIALCRIAKPYQLLLLEMIYIAVVAPSNVSSSERRRNRKPT